MPEFNYCVASSNGFVIEHFDLGSLILAGTEPPKSSSFRIPQMEPGDELVIADLGLNGRCCVIADQVVPQYRSGNYSCVGVYAKRWQAAYDGARLALT